MTSKLLPRFKQAFTSYKLVPTGGGAFEVSVNGELIYSKLKTGKFPDEQAVVDAVATRLKR